MLTRSKTDAKRENLKNSLREKCRVGELAAGAPVPGVRDLASEFGLSRDVVTDLLRELVSEGVLYTVPRVGTFAGRPPSEAPQTFLMVHGREPMNSTREQLVRMGFEDRLAELGAEVIVMSGALALELERQNQLPPIAGVLDYSDVIRESADETQLRTTWHEGTLRPDLPRVCFGVWPLTYPFTDFVALDDTKGGAKATQHLLERGYEKIAFLAFHPLEGGSALCRWSLEREIGWRGALQSAGQSPEGLSFHPAREIFVDAPNQVKDLMREPVQNLIANGEISAVVAANDAIAHCLLEGLHGSKTPQNRWPAIVGFDGSAEMAGQLLTSLRMPWNEVGRAAADLVWNRAVALPDAKPQIKRFPMRLITRLSCRPNWSKEAGHASLAAARAS